MANGISVESEIAMGELIRFQKHLDSFHQDCSECVEIYKSVLQSLEKCAWLVAGGPVVPVAPVKPAEKKKEADKKSAGKKSALDLFK